eukprot:457736-Lingulodinium_polyedra.AAC.1
MTRQGAGHTMATPPCGPPRGPGLASLLMTVECVRTPLPEGRDARFPVRFLQHDDRLRSKHALDDALLGSGQRLVG